MPNLYTSYNLEPDNYRITFIASQDVPVEHRKVGRQYADFFVQIRMHFNQGWNPSNTGRYHQKSLDLTREIMQWCTEAFGADNYGFVQTSTGLWILLRNEADAMMFKLAWNEG